MENDTAPALAPLPEAGPGTPHPPSLGNLRELLFFLLAGLALFVLVQSAALYLLTLSARRQDPHLPWPQLLRQVAERHQFDAFFAVPVQAAYYVLLLLLLYVMVRVIRGLPFWSGLAVRSLPWGHTVQALAAGILLALLINLLNLVIPPPEPLAFDRLFTGRAAALLIVSASLLLAPLVEEIVFRGYIYGVLERLWGVTPAVLGSGLLFGSIHFPQLWPGFFQMLLLCLVGVVFSLARARTGTTVASIVLHFSYNATISFFFLVSPTFRALPALF